MKIEARGRPPYNVSCGRMIVAGNVKEQFVSKKTWGEACEELFSLSDRGLLPRSQYIQDCDGEIVFNVASPSDLALLRQVDEFGL